jgi:hypothetical protein
MEIVIEGTHNLCDVEKKEKLRYAEVTRITIGERALGIS